MEGLDIHWPMNVMIPYIPVKRPIYWKQSAGEMDSPDRDFTAMDEIAKREGVQRSKIFWGGRGWLSEKRSEQIRGYFYVRPTKRIDLSKQP